MIPAVELTAYAAHSHKGAMNHDDSQAVFKGWRVPCLGLTVVGKLNTSGSLDEFDMMYIIPGPYITFYAMILLGQCCIVSLTSTLSCIASACEGNDRKALYAAFDGALDLLVGIDGDAARFIRTPTNSEFVGATPTYKMTTTYVLPKPKFRTRRARKSL